MSAPYMPFYTGDYIRDTVHLTPEQHGAYLLLLFSMWDHGGELANDASSLRRAARVDQRRWRKVWEAIRPFFRVIGDSLRHKRIDEELQRTGETFNKRSNAGKKGGRPRGQMHATERNESVPHGEEQNGSSRRGKNLNEINETAKAKLSSARDYQSNNDSPNGESKILAQTNYDDRVDNQPEPELPLDQTELPARRSAEERMLLTEFTAFYKRYPEKRDKPASKRAWLKARQRASFDVIMNGLECYIADKPPDRPWRYPATWLNGDGWEDEPAPPVQVNRSQPAFDEDRKARDFMARLAAERRAAHG